MRSQSQCLKITGYLLAMVCICCTNGCQEWEQRAAKKNPAVKKAFEFKRLSWIAGTWANEKGKTSVHESWKRIDDLTLEGLGYRIESGDTSITELLKLQQIERDIFYIADVSHNPAPVFFKLVHLSDSSAVFENPEHDFPNRIIYTLKSDSLLHVRTEGMGDGERKGFDFYFTRKK